MNALAVIFYGLSGLGGMAGMAALYNVHVQKSKIHAEAKRIGIDSDVMMSDQALKMYTLARTEAQEAKKEARECRVLIGALESHVDNLERIMWDNGLKPPAFHFPSARAE